jgi:hypothetical protein
MKVIEPGPGREFSWEFKCSQCLSSCEAAFDDLRSRKQPEFFGVGRLEVYVKCPTCSSVRLLTAEKQAALTPYQLDMVAKATTKDGG